MSQIQQTIMNNAIEIVGIGFIGQRVLLGVYLQSTNITDCTTETTISRDIIYENVL